jgi:5-methylthioadenosine/S-adenosylhomocysteine deaminase
VDAEDRVLHPGAVTITGNRISGVFGPGEPVPAARRVIRGPHKLVLPGFVNIHAHTVLCGLRGKTEDAPAEVSLHSHILPFRARMTPERAWALARLGALESVRFGSTTIVDLYWQEDAIARAFAEVGVRGVLGQSISEVDLLQVGRGVFEFDRERGEETLRRAEDIITKWHGYDGGRFHCVLAPHAPDDCSPDLLRRIGDLARRHDIPIAMHVSQSRSEENRIRAWYGKSSTQFLADIGLLGPRLIGGHCVFLSDEDIALYAKSGAWVAYMPVINAKRGYAAPAAQLAEAGANLSLGADNMTGDMVLAAQMATMVGRITTKNSLVLPPRDVLRMATMGGARALGRGGEIGSIEVGKRADLVVIDLDRPHLWPIHDPITTYFHWGQAGDIETVVVDGDVVIEDGRHTRLDFRTVAAAAQNAAEMGWGALWEQGGTAPR